MAQLNVQNTGTFYIGSATDTFFVGTSFSNTSGAAFINNGMLYVKQDISNDQPAMTVGTGTLLLNGSSAQTISGSQVFKTFNLVTGNAAGISLDNNLSITGVHTYTAGMITTAAIPNYLVYEAGASYSGSNDSRHVNGWVKKIGSTSFSFPVGNSMYERPVALTNLSAAGEFNVRYSRTTPNRLSVYNPLVYVDTAEYWTINKISGSAAQVTMNWDNSKVPFPNFMITDIKAAGYDGIFWRNIGGTATGNALTTGSVTSTGITAFSRNFTIGSTAYVLPVKITGFAAAYTNGYTKLNWTASNEPDVINYELQRSDDGINFYTIHTQAVLNRNGTAFYSYDDRKVLTATTTFYRLKINDITTQVNYSYVITVSANATDRSFYVITNPVNTSIDIYASAAMKGLYNFSITNTGGQVIQYGTLDINNPGTYSIYLRPGIIAGAYILVVQNETNRLQQMIIKK